MGIWQREITSVFLLFLLVSIVGGLTGLFLPLFLLLVLAILIQQIFQITRFEKWIRQGGRSQYPKTKGVWEEIYYHVYRIKKNERRRKKKLSKVIDQFRQSTEALPDAAVVLGSNDEIEWANKTALKVLGLKSSDRGQRIPNLVRFPEFIRYLKSGNYEEAVVVPSPVNSQMTLAVRVVSYGAGLRLLLAQDVTQLKKMERMRKDFVANVSHELRTPLTVLKGYIETLQDMDDGESSLLTNSVQQMQTQIDRMQHLVDDLLLLTRLETQQCKTQCIDAPALLTQICKESSDMLGNADRIELILDTQVHVMGEELALRSAFSNLLSNALKYSPDDTKVKVRWYQNAEAVIMSVEDKGEGIAAADIPRVSERFYRIEAKRTKKVPGIGLGLAIVKHALMRQDAYLVINSELGKGSCFSCHFPVAQICTPKTKVKAIDSTRSLFLNDH